MRGLFSLIVIVSMSVFFASVHAGVKDYKFESRKAYVDCKRASSAPCEPLCKEALIAVKLSSEDALDKIERCFSEHGKIFPDSAFKIKKENSQEGAVCENCESLPDVIGTFVQINRYNHLALNAPGNKNWKDICGNKARVEPKQFLDITANIPRAQLRATKIKLSKLHYRKGSRHSCVASELTLDN